MLSRMIKKKNRGQGQLTEADAFQFERSEIAQGPSMARFG